MSGPPVRRGVFRYLLEEAVAKEQELALGLSVNGENLGIGKVVAHEYAASFGENTPGLRSYRISHGRSRSHKHQRQHRPNCHQLPHLPSSLGLRSRNPRIDSMGHCYACGATRHHSNSVFSRE